MTSEGINLSLLPLETGIYFSNSTFKLPGSRDFDLVTNKRPETFDIAGSLRGEVKIFATNSGPAFCDLCTYGLATYLSLAIFASYKSNYQWRSSTTIHSHQRTIVIDDSTIRNFGHVATLNINFFRGLVAAIGRKHKPHRSQKGGDKAKGKNSWRGSVGRIFNMGNEESTPIDESTPPNTLTGRTIEAVAEYIKSGRARKIVVMTGAGISTSAGIPDFRSPETGLYANLARLNLPYAEAVFDIGYFREHPEPFYTLAHELYPGKYRPTITHSFIRLLHDKGLLLKLFTQNIDCLEREAGVPDDKIIEAHGSFARQSCIECKAPYPDDEIRKHVAEKTIPKCHECQGLVKPEIVFFGEALPAAFFEARMLPAESDLAIVIGTSLTVAPFSTLPGLVQEDTPRILMNRERVGGMGGRADDVLILEDCDHGVKRLAEACGWLEDLEALWAKTAKEDTAEKPPAKEKTRDEALEDEINKLTADVDKTLDLSKWHTEKYRNDDPPKTQSKATESDGDLDHVFVGGPRVDSFTPAAGSKSADDNSKL